MDERYIFVCFAIKNAYVLTVKPCDFFFISIICYDSNLLLKSFAISIPSLLNPPQNGPFTYLKVVGNFRPIDPCFKPLSSCCVPFPN